MCRLTVRWHSWCRPKVRSGSKTTLGLRVPKEVIDAWAKPPAISGTGLIDRDQINVPRAGNRDRQVDLRNALDEVERNGDPLTLINVVEVWAKENISPGLLYERRQ